MVWSPDESPTIHVTLKLLLMSATNCTILQYQVKFQHAPVSITTVWLCVYYVCFNITLLSTKIGLKYLSLQ